MDLPLTHRMKVFNLVDIKALGVTPSDMQMGGGTFFQVNGDGAELTVHQVHLAGIAFNAGCCIFVSCECSNHEHTRIVSTLFSQLNISSFIMEASASAQIS